MNSLTPVIIAEFKRAAAEKRAECLARRERVLAYVDLERRLTQPPLSYARADQWNGYVPPTLTGDGALTISPRRRALVEISAEALRREREEQDDGA